jgi:beta-barrel assembly-enhancing protease
MKQQLKPLSIRLLSCAVITSIACASLPLARAQDLPDLGDSSSSVLSDAKEREIGSSVMKQIRADPSFRDDPEYVDYLTNIGKRLLAASSDARYANRDVEFFLLQDDTMNAFALLGGYIAIYSGLILTTDSEPELIGVMAHEVAHLIQRHQARGQQESAKATLASLAALAIAIAASRSNSSSASNVTEAALIGSQALQIQNQLNYTREFEREADRIGYSLMEKAGFDTRGMASFFGRMQKAERFNDPGESRVPGYLRTHPLSGERLADMQNRASSVRSGTLISSRSSANPNQQPALSAAPAAAGALSGADLPSSLDYQLIKAKLQAERGSASEAVELFKQRISQQSIRRSRADAYGYAIALTRNRQFDLAITELKRIRTTGEPHPMIELALSRALRDNGNASAALLTLQDAAERYSDKRAIVVALAETQAATGNKVAALKTINDLSARFSDNSYVRFAQARIADAAGNKVLAHRAQAEGYYLRQQVREAIGQLEQAIRVKGGDEYEIGAAQTRLRQMRLEMEGSPQVRERY